VEVARCLPFFANIQLLSEIGKSKIHFLIDTCLFIIGHRVFLLFVLAKSVTIC
jgi:hypothetical protein